MNGWRDGFVASIFLEALSVYWGRAGVVGQRVSDRQAGRWDNERSEKVFEIQDLKVRGSLLFLRFE